MHNQIPTHLAIIPDGNRRWAKKQGLVGIKGHAKAVEFKNVTSLLDQAQKIGIKYISIWGFSTENWKRPLAEKKFLFNIIINLTKELKDYAQKNRIRFRHIGRKDRLPKDVILALEKFENKTKNNCGLSMQLCLDYGGRDEIVRAVKKIIRSNKKEINENSFTNYLDTADIPPPDLIIRTGGEYRLSGFMLYQSSYAELYFTNTLFPDFKAKDLRKAVKEFSRRTRTFGGD